MNEEINIKFGASLDGFSSGLRSMKSMVKEAALGVKDSLKEAFASFAAPLTVGGGIAYAVESFRSLMEDVQNFKRISESTGLSLGLTQDMLSLAKATGIAGGEVESMIDKFVKNLPPGSDPEMALYAIADKLAGIEDPATRAQMAMDLFGKSGVRLLPILKQGADGIRKMSEEWGKLSDAEVAELDRTQETLEKADHSLKIWEAHMIEGGKNLSTAMQKMPAWQKVLLGPLAIVGAYRDASKAAPDYSYQGDVLPSRALPTAADLNKAKIQAGIEAARKVAEAEEFYRAKPEEKILILTRQILALRREADDASDEEARAKISERILDTEKQRDAIQKDIAQRAEELARTEKRNADERLKLQQQISKLGRERAVAQMSDYMPTIGQLADSGFMTFRHNQWEWQQGPFAAMAQQLQFLQGDATQSLIWGNSDRFSKDVSEIDRIKAALTSAGVMSPDDKLASIDESMKAATDKLNGLLTAATKGGMIVRGPDE